MFVCTNWYIASLEIQNVANDNMSDDYHEVLFDSLQPYTNYSFYVHAFTDKRMGARSQIVTVVTDEDGQKFICLLC